MKAAIVGFFFGIALPSFGFAQGTSDSTSPLAAPIATEAKELGISLPQWIVDQAFELDHRMEVQFDGSEKASSIQRESQINNRVRYHSVDKWRARRELAFQGTGKEVLQTPEGSFEITSTNRKVSLEKQHPHEFWSETLRFPFDLSRRWGFFNKQENWEDWYQAVVRSESPLKNADGDELEITIDRSKEGQTVLRLNFRGELAHDSQTRYSLVSEWTLHLGKTPQQISLDESLQGGTES